MSAPNHTNSLVNEKSPYLLQHAHNPVAWHPWGEEAFAKARTEGKPVFLSIGYSTCHWCHVMAHESFENEDIAELLNTRFICIKVDREERPDVDSIYMQVCQAMTGQGGWPLSVFLTPDKKPFYAGTYFPPEGRYGRPGFKEVITQLSNQYKVDQEKITRIGQQAMDALKPMPGEGGDLGEAAVHLCFRQLQQSFDAKFGGFGREPKFPTPHNLMFLLRYQRWTGNRDALDMVTRTLDAMAAGGIYDHLGYGFSRYATDRQWLVPHFEKMLYDNALLAIIYTEAWQVTRNPRYMSITREILDYAARVMASPAGGFYCAEDADSEGEEGLFYLWDKAEIQDILDPQEGILFCSVYNITDKGNFEGRNIPNLIGTDLEKTANEHNVPLSQLHDVLQSCRGKLFAVRERRVHPHKDDKILTAWNALLIAALAMASRAFGDAKYLEQAKKAYAFIEEMLTTDGRLMARWREGEAKYKGYIDDYAFLLWACHELYYASLDTAYLVRAKELARAMEEMFWDEETCGFYFYGSDSEALIVRPKEIYDGAMPSGNSVAARELLRLARLTGDAELEARANLLISAFAGSVKNYPAGYTHFMQAVLFGTAPGKEVVILGAWEDKDTQRLLTRLKQSFVPEISWLAAQDPKDLTDVAPFAAALQPLAQPSVHICQGFACSRPETDIAMVINQLIQ